jgi:oligo-1,6-glucosidase
MTNFDFKSLDEVNDVESHNLNKLMKKFHIPAWLRWKWIKVSSRDNARTPLQWSSGVNAGFTTGRPWLGLNSNYTKINYEAQKNDPDSVLAFYKKLIQVRLSSECLRAGVFMPLFAKGSIMAYRRELRDSGGKLKEAFCVMLNFSAKAVTIPKSAAELKGRVVLSSTGKTIFDRRLQAWEGVLLCLN